VILCSNLEYMERFARYIRQSHWHSQVRLHQFSSPEALERYRQAGGEAHVVLCEKPWRDPCAKLFSSDRTPIVTLTDQADEPAADELLLRMYQPVSRLLHQLQRLREGLEPAGRSEAFGKQKATAADRRAMRDDPASSMVKMAVASPYGGSGVTTIACHLAKLLAMRLEKVLYLHLDLYPEPVMAPDVEHDLSRLLYALTTRPERLMLEWHLYCGRHPSTGVYTLRPPVIRRDLRDLTTEHVRQICDVFRMIGFQAVVLDLDAHWLDDLVDGQLQADECWLVAPWQRRDFTHYPHLRAFAERSHVRLILNQVSGPPSLLSAADNPHIEAVLPYMGVRDAVDEPYQSSERFESIISRLILDSPVLGGVARDE